MMVFAYSEFGIPRLFDVAKPDEAGILRGYYGGKTLDEVQAEHPDATLMSMDALTTAQENALRTEPVQITEEEYMDALEVLPPLDWVIHGRTQSFKFVERFSGAVTSIFAKKNGAHWTFRDVDTLTHEEIMARVDEVAA